MLTSSPTPGDVINSMLRATRKDPRFLRAQRSWAYYRCIAYNPRFGVEFDSPYVEWDEEAKGPRPVCLPLGKIIVDSSAEFLFGKPPKFVTNRDADEDKGLQDVVNKIAEQNQFAAELLPEARSCGNEGSTWIKFSWTPQDRRCPVTITFLSPWEVNPIRNPLNAKDIQAVEIRIKYFNDADGKWYLYKERWTPEEATYYVPIETDEHDDQRVAGKTGPDWPIADTTRNPFGLIPIREIKNRRTKGLSTGYGDLWDLYPLLNQFNHTFWLMHFSNQADGDPVTAILNATEAPDYIAPGETVKLNGTDVALERIYPEDGLRQYVQEYAEQIERLIMDSVGSDRLKPQDISNKGNLTRSVLELMFQRSVRTTHEKRINWGTMGLSLFWEDLLLGLSRVPEAVAKWPALAKVDGNDEASYDVSTSWPPMFNPTSDERTAGLKDLALSVQQGFLTRERAVEIAAEFWGIEDVEALKSELEEQISHLEELDEAQIDAMIDQANNPPQPGTPGAPGGKPAANPAKPAAKPAS